MGARDRIDDVGFDPPTGLEDASAYVYRAGGVELTVDHGRAGTAAEQLDGERQRLTDYFGDAVEFRGGPITPLVDQLAGQPVVGHRYVLEGAHGVSVAADVDGGWVRLAFIQADGGEQLDALVPAVCSSFGDRGRVRAGRWRFELPASFSTPRSRVWLEPEAEWRVTVRVHPLDAPSPDLDREVARFEARGWRVRSREDVPIVHGALVRLLLDDDLGDGWFATRSVQAFERGNPVQTRYVEVSALGPDADAVQLRARVDALLASLTVGERAIEDRDG